MVGRVREATPPADWTLSPNLDPSGSEVGDLLLRLRRSNRALDRLRHALEGDEAAHPLPVDAARESVA